ncbi:Fc receptor-like protein 5 [Leptodactylus fuscus]|uniref:Fc receptor-like protein 5 n=1 Tax=Leptodactylus fuscus TaxID=238119 RepID=UPI003F4EF5FD
MAVLTLLTLISSPPLVIFTASNSKNERDILRPTVSCSPWNHIYSGDSVTLQCDIGQNKNIDGYYFYWYKDNKELRQHQRKHKFTIQKANSYDTGVYECWSGSGERSHPLSLYVIYRDQHKVILQTPPDIVEGDSLDMRCHSSPGRNQEEDTTFYKDGAIIQSSGHILHLPNVKKSMSGIYRCQKTFPNEGLLKTEETFVFVQDLFTSPKIKAPSKIIEGDAMTVTCDTRRNPLREDTELQFIFYRNGQIVQNISSSTSSSTYRVRPAQLEDSGNYTCEVRTPSDTVMKMSDTSYISITAAVNNPHLMPSPNMAAVGDDIVLRCESSKGSLPIYYQFYHSHTLLGNITVHQKEAAELRVTITSLTMGGSYYCASYNDLQTQQQHSDVASVLVMEPVANITITTDKEGENFELGESLTFNCSVQRGTSISFFWLHNETMVEQRSEIYHLQDDGKVLYIPSLQYHHEGTYQCHANNELSANRTFSVQSEIRKVHILELSSIGRSIQWVMLGILLLLIILAVGLIFTYWDKIVSAGRCKKPPPTDTQQNNEDVDKPNTTPETEVVYENFRQQENIYEEDEGYTYITVRAVQAPPSCPAAATRENVTVLYSTVRSSGETIQIDPAFISHARIRYYLGPDLSVQQLQYDITSSAHEDLFQSKKLHIYPVLCTLIMGNSGDILRPTVSCSPWNHIYSGDSVTLQCDIGQNKNIDGYYFYWYKDNKELRQHQRKHKFTIQKANSYDTGVYECWSGSGERSHPLSLYVIYRDKDRPSVTFRPNYRSIFVGETMEMSCDLRSSTSPFQDYVWYKDIEELMIGQKYIIQRATVNDTGNYRYEKGRGANYPVRLDVYYQHKVILQTPPDIVEGDSLDMRCHSSPGRNEEKDTTFYKDGAIIQLSGHILHLPNVKKSMSGIYRCEKIIPNEGLLKTEETFVFVQGNREIFSLQGPHTTSSSEDPGRRIQNFVMGESLRRILEGTKSKV